MLTTGLQRFLCEEIHQMSLTMTEAGSLGFLVAGVFS